MSDTPRAAFTRRRIVETALALSALAPAEALARPLSKFETDKIEQLIAQMTLEEKGGQLTINPDVARAGALANANPSQKAEASAVMAQIRKGQVGALFNGTGAAGGRELQRVAVEESRLKIPLIFAADIIHGYETIFPIPLGEASAFDPDLCERTTRAAAVEATAVGLHWTFAPMVDIARDQRWGRVSEGAGEDPYLGALIAAARVRGFQGRDLRDEDTMVACPKHFAAYGAVAGGMEYASADIPETTLRNVHLPPFKAAFDAGALTTMSSFNDIAGVPATGNRHLLTDILRGEWGFKGLVVTDYTADEELILHGYAKDGRDASRIAVGAGAEMAMTSNLNAKWIPDLVKSGDLPLAVVDEAVRRVLRVKAALGLFDNPYRSLDPAREKRLAKTKQFRPLARESARRSIVLLKNEGDLLPLPKSGRRYALIGPLGAGDDDLFGAWAFLGDRGNAVSLEAGLRAALKDQGALTVVKGSNVETPIPGGIEAAVAAARACDVVLLAIGEAQSMSGEAQSRVEISVPPPQQALAEAVAATGKPVVVLLRHGRALALKGAVRDARAIMATWFLGSETGNAIADVLFGDVAPSGRLPVSFPVESGQEPYYYNHRPSGRPQLTDDANYKSRYRETPDVALYSFGHGLTYTRFQYGPVQLSAPTLSWGGKIEASCEIANVGRVAGEEVAQLYIYDRVASITQPRQSLKGYQRVSLRPGQKTTVRFTLTRADLEFWGADLVKRAEPGEFDLWIAPASATGQSVRFTLASQS